MDTFISHSPEETLAHGEAWATQVQSGTVIALQGDLGAGKTHWVKGLARGLDIVQPILSPTFALLQEYREGRLPLFHIDLYRLEGPEDVIGAGLEEYLHRPPGVTVVEWPERWLEVERLAVSGLPPRWTWLRLESPTETTRIITPLYGTTRP